VCRSGSGLRRQRPRGPLSRRHGGAPQSGARVRAKAGDGRLLAIPQRPYSWGACSLGDAQCLVKCLLQGCPGIDDPAGPAHDPNSADTAPWSRDSALIAEGPVRPPNRRPHRSFHTHACHASAHHAPFWLQNPTDRRCAHLGASAPLRIAAGSTPPYPLLHFATAGRGARLTFAPSGRTAPRCENRRSPFQTGQV